MKSKRKTAGKWLLVLGILTLAAGIITAFAVGTVAVPILIIASIVLNSVAVELIRGGKGGKG